MGKQRQGEGSTERFIGRLISEEGKSSEHINLDVKNLLHLKL